MSATLNESRTYLRERRAYDKDFPLNAKNRKLLEALGFAVF